MSELILSNSLFDLFVKHLVDIEEEKDRVISEYYPNITYERDNFKQLIGNYIEYIEDFISKAKVGGCAGDTCPFVTIGSVVEIEDMEYNETERLKIVSPFAAHSNVECNCASYLSPMGRALLLKKEKERVEIKTPAGKAVYQIKSIEIPLKP